MCYEFNSAVLKNVAGLGVNKMPIHKQYRASTCTGWVKEQKCKYTVSFTLSNKTFIYKINILL